jgi:hypothetical protein
MCRKLSSHIRRPSNATTESFLIEPETDQKNHWGICSAPPAFFDRNLLSIFPCDQARMWGQLNSAVQNLVDITLISFRCPDPGGCVKNLDCGAWTAQCITRRCDNIVSDVGILEIIYLSIGDICTPWTPLPVNYLICEGGALSVPLDFILLKSIIVAIQCIKQELYRTWKADLSQILQCLWAIQFTNIRPMPWYVENKLLTWSHMCRS